MIKVLGMACIIAALHGGAREINPSDLEHSGAEIKTSHVENRLAVTLPIAVTPP